MSQSERAGRRLLRDLLGRSRQPTGQTDKHSGATTPLDLDDIQGFILHGYRMPMVRHFLLKVSVPAKARALLERLVSSNANDAPQITTAKDWHVGFEAGRGDDPAGLPRYEPDYCLNLGITLSGLIALEIKDRLPTLSFKSFDTFVASG